MKVFLTGGSGYLGRPKVEALRRHGHEVSALAQRRFGAGAHRPGRDPGLRRADRHGGPARGRRGGRRGDPPRPALRRRGLVYGLGGGLIETFFRAPVPLIGDSANHWALVHASDIAELYALALRAPAKSVYAGVSGQNVPLADIVSVLAAGGPITRLTLAEAVARMGPIAEAFALDQQLMPGRARRELSWTPRHLDALRELRG